MHPEAVIGRLREAFPLGEVAAEVRDILERNRGEAPWALACSGGPDSVFLACWVRAFFERQPAVLLYFDHGTRGDAHRTEAALVRALADDLGYDFVVGTRPEGRDRDEASLRRDRFEFLVGATPGKLLLLGQQADDVAETLIMRLGRGSGIEGLAAPRGVHHPGDGIWRVRPLLGVRALAIRSFLEHEGIDVCEDASNQSGDYLRNRVRATLMPALRKVFSERDPIGGLLRSHRLLGEDAEGWQEWVECSMHKAAHGEELRFADLPSPCPRALRRRLLYRWWAEAAGEAFAGSADLVELILDASASAQANEEQVFAVTSRLCLRVERGRWTLARANPPRERTFAVSIHGSGGVALAGGRYLGVDWWPLGRMPGDEQVRAADGQIEAWLDADRIHSRRLMIRCWRFGDRFRPLGAPGMRKLQDWFTDRKWSTTARHEVPVVTDAIDQVLWVPGFAPAHVARIREGTERVLHLTYY